MLTSSCQKGNKSFSKQTDSVKSSAQKTESPLNSWKPHELAKCPMTERQLDQTFSRSVLVRSCSKNSSACLAHMRAECLGHIYYCTPNACVHRRIVLVADRVERPEPFLCDHCCCHPQKLQTEKPVVVPCPSCRLCATRASFQKTDPMLPE